MRSSSLRLAACTARSRVRQNVCLNVVETTVWKTRSRQERNHFKVDVEVRECQATACYPLVLRSLFTFHPFSWIGRLDALAGMRSHAFHMAFAQSDGHSSDTAIVQHSREDTYAIRRMIPAAFRGGERDSDPRRACPRVPPALARARAVVLNTDLLSFCICVWLGTTCTLRQVMHSADYTYVATDDDSLSGKRRHVVSSITWDQEPTM